MSVLYLIAGCCCCWSDSWKSEIWVVWLLCDIFGSSRISGGKVWIRQLRYWNLKINIEFLDFLTSCQTMMFCT